MSHSKRLNNRLKASNERLQAITKDIDRIQEKSLRTWAAVKFTQVRSKELQDNLDELIIKQEDNFNRLVTIAERA
ncbi:hypothetical protein [Paenibacillus medicaginis]|uniref:Uncharacterized protein n=1 Tax=Paenibacillus medicaginis TaxID=1470560 RepID=A0ABV5C4V7_9BACL